MTMNQRRVFTALAVSALAACSGGEKPKADTTAAAPAAGAAPAAAPVAAQPATGKTWDVKMYGDPTGSRFDPVTVTIKSGDAIRWTIVNGPPHNVAFWSDSLPAAAVPVLTANMPESMGPLMGQMMTAASQAYTVSFAGVPAGTYKYYCVPHLALGMKGVIVVQ